VQFAREQGRDRRLLPEEEARLLAQAGPHLQALIIAALEGVALVLQILESRADKDAEGACRNRPGAGSEQG
jgi:hypothetical protein